MKSHPIALTAFAATIALFVLFAPSAAEAQWLTCPVGIRDNREIRECNQAIDELMRRAIRLHESINKYGAKINEFRDSGNTADLCQVIQWRTWAAKDLLKAADNLKYVTPSTINHSDVIAEWSQIGSSAKAESERLFEAHCK